MVFFINLSIHTTFGGRIFFLSGLEKRKRQNIERTILTSSLNLLEVFSIQG